MNTELLISCDDWENRVAVLEEGSLAEIYFEREEKVIGSIYNARVENVLPGMGACFVNIGLGRNAFLYVDDIRRDPINIGETEITDRRKGHTVNELLKVGDEILVQIVKEPRGLKGARVSTNISLPGRYLVLMPTGRYSGVSSRIEDERERERLKQVMRRVRPEGMATIVRTAARGVSEAELIADLGVQLRLWHGILESYQRSSAPALLHKDLNLVFKAVRDFMTSDVRQVVIDSKEQYDEIRSTMSLLGPQYLSRLKLWEGPGDLFEARGIDDELQKLLKPKIMLPSGGYLILEHTEALTVIDVNTGKFTGGRNLEDTLVRTNIEAAAEIARQVRLRDIGGIIVVDFIDMAHERSRQQVIETLSEALKRDRTRSTIQEFSNLGLLEFTRKRVGKDLAGQLRSDCPYCGGLGDVMSSESLAIHLLRQMRMKGQSGRGKRFDLVVDPSVATQLVGWYREEFEKLSRQYQMEVQLFVEPHRHRESITLENARRTRRPLVAGREIEADLQNVRLPDPSSGVAVYDGNIIEVKDAASGAGSSAKLRVTSVDGDLARAELAEPLQAPQRRRRRGRGRGKAAVETEAPIAPPTPTAPERPAREDRDSEIAARAQRPPREEAPARPVRHRELPPLAYGMDDDEEEDFSSRGGRIAGGAVGGGSAARGRQPSETPRRESPPQGERGRGGRGRNGGGGRGSRPPHYPQPLIVGGEGDIDYEDDADSVVVGLSRGRSAPAERPNADLTTERETDEDAGPSRRRRRGRGRGPGDPVRSAGVGPRDAYDEDDTESGRSGHGRSEPRAIESERPARGRGVSDRDVRPAREPREGRESREARGSRDVRDARGPRDSRDVREPRDGREGREPRDSRDTRDPRDGREVREPRDSREAREPRDSRGVRGPRDGREVREPRESRDARDPRDVREARGSREPLEPRGHREDRGRHDEPEREARDERPARRPHRHFGPIQQLYGKPLEISEEDAEESPPPRGPRDEPRGERHARPADVAEREPRSRSATPPPEDDDEMDVVIGGGQPRHVEVEFVEDWPRAGRRDARDRDDREGREDQSGREGRNDRPDREGREDRPDRQGRGERPERVSRPERPEREGRGDRASHDGEREGRRGPRRDGERPRGGRSERGRGGPSEPRIPRPVKQLYPPPGTEEPPAPEGAPKALPFASRRTPRGPMMRDAGAEPPPKGKVRQLYPPPEFDEEYVEENSSPAPARSRADHETPESMFVTAPNDLEERRRQARERADARRDALPPEDADGGGQQGREPLRSPFDDDRL